MFIIGGFDDQLNLLVWGKISKTLFSIENAFLANFPTYQNIFRELLNPFDTTRPILELLVSTTLTIFGEGFVNVLIIVFLLLNLFWSYTFFKRYKNALVYALIFSFSSYIWVHLIHLSLLSIWVIPLFALLLDKFETKKDHKLKYGFLLGLYMALVVLFANYLGFFILAYFSVRVLSRLLWELLFERKFNSSLLAKYLISSFSCGAILLALLFPYLSNTYVSEGYAYGAYGFSKNMNRTYEDFFYFSSRPWYFVLPSIKNPFFGEIAQKAYSTIESTGYFLADDYLWNEHSASYFGLALSLSTCFLAAFVLLKGDYAVRKKIGLYTLCFLFIVSFCMPPYITFSQVKIYTPGYLMYLFFPMFRVTTRMSILLLFCVLNIFGIALKYIVSRYGNMKKYIGVYMGLILCLTLGGTFIPPRIYKVPKPPDIYLHVSQNTPSDSVFAVYPYGKTQEAFYWTDVHQRALINPRGYVYYAFDAELFTHDLTTMEGLAALRALNVDYLVVFDTNDNLYDVGFFENHHSLDIVTTSYNATLYKVNHENLNN
jgi:hypothetical protein